MRSWAYRSRLAVLAGALLAPWPVVSANADSDPPPPATGLAKWAARAPLGSRTDAPRTGRFLVARRQVVGPFFHRSVVLLLSHGGGGTLGVIINRPMDLAIAELLPDIEEVQGRSEQAYFGGPVEPNRIMVLIESSTPPADSLPVVGNIHASRSLEVFRTLAKSSDPGTRFRAYVGYAGWGPGQLDAELAKGDWHVDTVDPDAIYSMPSEEVWPLFIRRNSGIQARKVHLQRLFADTSRSR